MTAQSPGDDVAGPLRSALERIGTESEATRLSLKAAERARKIFNGVFAGLLVVLIVLVGLLVVITKQNNDLVHQVNHVAQQMADCTTPGGQCYSTANARTGKAIADVIRAEVYMAQCARLFPGESGESYDRKLEACVYARLTQAATTQPPPPAPTPGPSPS